MGMKKETKPTKKKTRLNMGEVCRFKFNLE